MAESNLGGEQNPGAGGQPASGAGGGQPAAGSQNPAGGGQGGNTQPGSGAAAGGGEKVFSYKEDRTDWIPRHRLNEVGGKLTEAEKRAQVLESTLEQERARVRALSGVEQPDPKAKELSEIRNAILEMFPGLAVTGTMTADQLQEVMEASRAARDTNLAQWRRHADTMFADLDTEASDRLGLDKLTDSQRSRLQRAYREEATLAANARDAAVRRGERQSIETTPSDTDFIARHERGDKSLVKEFVKGYLDDFYEPARRSVTAQQANRMRPVPRGERTRLPLATGAQSIDLNDNKAFANALLQARRGGGRE